MLIQTTFFKLQTNVTCLAQDKPSRPEYVESIPFDVIIPLIEDLWKDEEYSLGENLDKLDRQLSEKEAQLRQRLNKCNEPSLYMELEGKLADVLHARCKISQGFDDLNKD